MPSIVIRIFLCTICILLISCFELDTPWPTVDVCVKAEGSYDRDEFFGGWIDADQDGENTRAEVLIEESLDPVTTVTYSRTNGTDVKEQRYVVTGRWFDPYTSNTFSNAIDLDVDHVVPLKEAWDSGACHWNTTKRVEFANELGDPNHLLAVDNSENRRKGSNDPTAWLPPNQSYIKSYLEHWLSIKIKWGLTADEGEYNFFATNAAKYRIIVPSGFKRTTCFCGE